MSTKPRKSAVRVRASPEVAKLRGLLAEARATLSAVQNGDVDAVVIESKRGPQIYTLDGAEFDYRVLIESMNEGALVLSRSAVILYANMHFSRMSALPLAQIIGSSVLDLISLTDRAALGRILKRAGSVGSTLEVSLQRLADAPMQVRVSIQRLPGRNGKDISLGMVVSDLTDLRGREDLLRSFSHGLMRLQEAERQQIATDLGENISQLLSFTLLRCQAMLVRLPLTDAGLRRDAIEFASLLRTAAADVSRITIDLKPHGLEILGLVPAMRAVAAEYAERLGLPVQVSFARLTSRLPVNVELALYRVLQEALRNVERHARAGHVSVTLKRRGPTLQLWIKDDGIGFNASAALTSRIQAGRFGLLSMRERAIAVGGTLLVHSSSSAGTEVRLSVPRASVEPEIHVAASRPRRRASPASTRSGGRGLGAIG